MSRRHVCVGERELVSAVHGRAVLHGREKAKVVTMNL